MCTRGYFVYKHRGRYYVYFSAYDSHPGGLGLHLLAGIPVEPDRFQEWLNHHRADLDQVYLDWTRSIRPKDEKHIDLHDVTTTRPTTRPHDDILIEWVYELDLDILVFSLNHCPTYPLDHMPPRDIFLEGLSVDNYHRRACSSSVPSEYRFNFTPPPPVEDSAAEVYQLHHSSGGPVAIHEILSRHENLSQRETVCAQALEVTLGITMGGLTRPTIYEMQVLPNLESMTSNHRKLMDAICRVAICPAYYRTDMWSNFEGSLMRGPFWWFRKHICIRPSVHLEDDRNLQLCISELFTEVMSKEGEGIMYGVAFSLFHCCIVRIDRAGNGTFNHTAALPFLPSPWAESRSTEGITALARLGDLPGIDDDVYFLILRDLYKYDHGEDSNEDSSSSTIAVTSRKSPRLPFELLENIANFIDSADTMNIFACSSRSTMEAALYWLKYPQVDMVDTCDGPLSVSIILHSAKESKVKKGDYSHLVSGICGACIDGEEVTVKLTKYRNQRGRPLCKYFFSRYVHREGKGNTSDKAGEGEINTKEVSEEDYDY